jgi:hypothetical protein
MNRIKWHLLPLAALAIGVAFTTQPHHRPAHYTEHSFAFSFYNANNTKMYYSMDLTNAGYVQGIDYDCETPTNVCTFSANPSQEQSDQSGNFFYTSDVPQSGIENTGSFVDYD